MCVCVGGGGGGGGLPLSIMRHLNLSFDSCKGNYLLKVLVELKEILFNDNYLD